MGPIFKSLVVVLTLSVSVASVDAFGIWGRKAGYGGHLLRGGKFVKLIDGCSNCEIIHALVEFDLEKAKHIALTGTNDEIDAWGDGLHVVHYFVHVYPKLAEKFGSDEALKFLDRLFTRRVSMDHYNKHGHSGIHMSAGHWHTDVVPSTDVFIPLIKKLVALGVSPDLPLRAKNWKGAAPLAYAGMKAKTNEQVSCPNPNIGQALIDAGADVNAVNEEGVTALHTAAENWCEGDLGYVRMLIDNGINVNAEDKNGATPLIFAASPTDLGSRSSYEMIRFLVMKGADRDARSRWSGMSAYDYVRERRDYKSAEYLKNPYLTLGEDFAKGIRMYQELEFVKGIYEFDLLMLQYRGYYEKAQDVIKRSQAMDDKVRPFLNEVDQVLSENEAIMGPIRR